MENLGDLQKMLSQIVNEANDSKFHKNVIKILEMIIEIILPMLFKALSTSTPLIKNTVELLEDVVDELFDHDEPVDMDVVIHNEEKSELPKEVIEEIKQKKKVQFSAKPQGGNLEIQDHQELQNQSEPEGEQSGPINITVDKFEDENSIDYSVTDNDHVIIEEISDMLKHELMNLREYIDTKNEKLNKELDKKIKKMDRKIKLEQTNPEDVKMELEKLKLEVLKKAMQESERKKGLFKKKGEKIPYKLSI